VAAAGRRDVGEDLAAAAGHEPGEGLGLSADPGRGVSATLTIVLDDSVRVHSRTSATVPSV
jgi:hypothetical protein